MSDNRLAVYLGLVDEVTPQLRVIKKFANQTGKEVMDVKRESMKNIRHMRTSAVRTMAGMRLMFSAFAGAIDPFFAAVLNTIGSAIETLYALATAEAATGVGIPAAAIHGAIATSIQVVTLPFILANITEAKEASDRAVAALDAFALFGGF